MRFCALRTGTDKPQFNDQSSNGTQVSTTMTMLSIGAPLDRLLPKVFSDFNHQRRRRPTHPLHRSLLSSSATGSLHKVIIDITESMYGISPLSLFHLNSAKHRNFGFSLQSDGCCDSRFRANRCLSESSSFEAEADQSSNYVSHPSATQNIQQTKASFVEILRGANAIIPHVVLASTLLALIYPPSFTWFTSRYYAPALGFLMFAVGVNSSEKDFIEAFSRPSAMLAGYIGQFLVKPLLGYLCGVLAVTVFGMPTSIGQRLPVDFRGMVSSITQIVISPIAAGLFLNRFFPQICAAIRPLLPPLSVFVTALCVGAPLSINRESLLSPFGTALLLIITAFHLSAFVVGYTFTGALFPKEKDVRALQRTISYETGMQSSLLAVALANKFFPDPLVAIPPAMSVVIMSLMGFSLVMLWAKRK